MTSLDLQTWLSLVSTIAIVLALVFAGVQVRATMISPSTFKETGSMKNFALVAVLLSVVSLPAFAQNKFIKEANAKLTVTEAAAPAPVEEAKQADEEKQTSEPEAATGATGDAAAEAPATDDAATAVDAATGEPATDAAAEPEKTEAKQ